MVNMVTKRDGSEEPFNEDKIKNAILAAAKAAGIAADQQSRIAKEVSEKTADFFEAEEEITTDEIREKVLSLLDALEPKVSEAWRKYDEEQGKISTD